MTAEIQRLVDKIIEWEHEAGEGFTDYFMHDLINDVEWAIWLKTKGFEERAYEILEETESSTFGVIDQQFLFNIHDEGQESYWKDDYRKDVELWAEFILRSEKYVEKVNNFFEEN